MTTLPYQCRHFRQAYFLSLEHCSRRKEWLKKRSFFTVDYGGVEFEKCLDCEGALLRAAPEPIEPDLPAKPTEPGLPAPVVKPKKKIIGERPGPKPKEAKCRILGCKCTDFYGHDKGLCKEHVKARARKRKQNHPKNVKVVCPDCGRVRLAKKYYANDKRAQGRRCYVCARRRVTEKD